MKALVIASAVFIGSFLAVPQADAVSPACNAQDELAAELWCRDPVEEQLGSTYRVTRLCENIDNGTTYVLVWDFVNSTGNTGDCRAKTTIVAY